MKYRKIYSVALALMLLFVGYSCSKNDAPLLPKGRTILVYIALDNNLSNEMSAMHASLKEGWAKVDADGSLLLFADSRGQTKPVLIKLEKRGGEVVSDTLRWYENENSASPQLLRQVIADTKTVAPAKSYGMLLFSHASGWLPEGAFKNPLTWGASAINGSKIGLRSVFEDNGREMEFHDFVEAIPDGMFEFIASEMCFMSSVETAYALRNKTKYLLAAATEVLSPGFIPIYPNSLSLLYKKKPNLEEFGQKFYRYFSELPDKFDRGVNSAAISLVKTSEMQALADFTRKVAPSLTQDQIDVVQHFDRIPPRSSSFPYLFFDYRDYIAQVATDAQLSELDKLLKKAVIFKASTPKMINIYIPKHSGLSVYIPQQSLPRLNKAYEDTEWYKAIKK